MKTIEITVSPQMGGLKCKIAIPEEIEQLKTGRINCSIEKIGEGEISFSSYRLNEETVWVNHVEIKNDEAIKNFIALAQKARLPLNLKKDRDGRYIGLFGFKLTDEQKELIRNTILQTYKHLISEKTEKEGVTIIFRQKVSDYDWPTIALDEWGLDEETCPYIIPKIKQMGVGHNKIRKYLSEAGLFQEKKRIFKGWSEVEVTDYIAALTKEQADKMLEFFQNKKDEKVRKEIETLQNMPTEEFVKKYFIRQVHVDEMGYFSDCDPYCDDCFWYDHFDYHITPKEILQKATTFTVRSRRGKVYTYYKPSAQLIEELCKHEAVEALRKEKIAQLKKNMITFAT